MGYSPGIKFQTSLVNMDKSKALPMNNKPGKSTDKKNTVPVWLLRALTHHLKGITYRDFLPKCEKSPWRCAFLDKR